MIDDFQPQEVFLIHDLATLRILSDPLRVQVLTLLVSRAMTVRELASVLNLPPTRLYYHISQLEKHGLIQVVETRIVSGIIEKHYRAVAISYVPDRELLEASGGSAVGGVEKFTMELLASAQQDLAESFRSGKISDQRGDPSAVFVRRGEFRLTPEQYAQLSARLDGILEELLREQAQILPAENLQTYSVFCLTFPRSNRQ